MSALNWVLQEKSVHLVSDTLVVAEDRSPLAFSTKIFPIVHARTLIAGTGLAELLGQAAFTVATSSVCRHVADVDRGLSHEIRRIWDRIARPGTGPSSTIYAFGWDETLQRMRAFAYRSSRNFVSEELPEGLGIKPQIPVDTGSIEPFDEFLVDLTVRQRDAPACCAGMSSE